MPPTLYLVRHAEGEHNVNVSSLFEPSCTALGLYYPLSFICATDPQEEVKIK